MADVSVLVEDVLAATLANSEILARRRSELVESARELFLSQGFHKTTMRQIARAAGWQLGTLYGYIERKEDVLYLLMEDIVSRKLAVLRAVAPRADAYEALVALIRAYYRFVDEHRPEIDFIYRESRTLLPSHLAAIQQLSLAQNEMFIAAIERAAAAGCLPPLDPALLAQTVLMCGDMWALKWWVLGGLISVDEYIAEQCRLLLSAG